MDRDKLTKAYIYNLITGAVITFSIIWMFSGIKFGVEEAALTSSKFAMFKYYTVDSNVIMGVIAFVVAYLQKKVLDGKEDKLTVWAYVLKLVGNVGVTLTMLVTVFFLAPTFENGWVTCFNNSNFFLHLINPLLSIFVFLKYERTKEVRFKHTFTGIVTMLIYAVYYVINCAVHSSGNVVLPGYDWYGFFALGLKSGVVVLPIIILVTYGISFALWKLNRIKVKVQ